MREPLGGIQQNALNLANEFKKQKGVKNTYIIDRIISMIYY